LESSVTVGLPFGLHESILRTGDSLEIRNLVDISGLDNTEIVMRLSTNIQSDATFYTDLNGLQIIKRERLKKIPLQANYYPVPSAIFIQDENFRLSLLSGQPLGGSSLKGGEIEIMQERRLNQDDDRGLGQGVLDNRPVLNIFRVVLESRESCRKLDDRYPAGFLTANSYYEQRKLLHPLSKFIFSENDWTGLIPKFGENHEPAEMGVEIVAMRELPHIKIKKKAALGLVVHRTNFEECPDANRDGTLYLRKLLGILDECEIYSSRLTLLTKNEQIVSDEINLCPMDSKAFIVRR
jgi:alpha-mannosidase II